MEHYDVVVVGAGAMGMSAGYHLAVKGLKTLLIDADDPPHRSGTHHGETRIIRHAYGEGREYTPMALRAQALWFELEKETGRKLFLPTGFLQTGDPKSQMLVEMRHSAQEHGLPVEILGAEAIRSRWPGLALPGSHIGCYEGDSGVLLCESCIAAYREAALARGAELKVMTHVLDIQADTDGATVVTRDASYRANALVLTAGKFAGPMLRSIGLTPALQPIRKSLSRVSFRFAGRHLLRISQHRRIRSQGRAARRGIPSRSRRRTASPLRRLPGGRTGCFAVRGALYARSFSDSGQRFIVHVHDDAGRTFYHRPAPRLSACSDWSGILGPRFQILQRHRQTLSEPGSQGGSRFRYIAFFA
jgi:hypothetical protein